MTIQFNTDHNVTASEKFKAPLIDLITEHLHQFSEHINRLEIHVSDENGDKQGPGDKRCVIEARITGQPPIAATANAATYEEAVLVASKKLKAAIGTKIDKLKEHS